MTVESTTTTGNPSQAGRPSGPFDIAARIRHLQQELAGVTRACDSARDEAQTGNLYFLLRKKWKLIQQLFEAQSQRLALAPSDRAGQGG